MPVHDWSRVIAGTFHDFHCGWIVEIRNALNGGLLPPDFYAMAEQVAGNSIPDVLALEAVGSGGLQDVGGPIAGATAVTMAPPRVQETETLDISQYAAKGRALVIRHRSDDRIVALIEIVSPGNKVCQPAYRSFLEKAADALTHGFHLMLIDLLPPSPKDPRGPHAALWAELGGEPSEPPADKPLTLAAYSAGPPVTAYLEPIAVGDRLPEMLLFLAAEWYVSVPLEATYQAAFRGVPRRWRDVLEPPLL